MNDLFNNPMVNSAKKAMTKEQMDEYKRIGEYMYNTDIYRTADTGSKVKEDADPEDLLLYASEALKAGLDPMDLSQEEVRTFVDVYGDLWYERFGFKKDQVPILTIQMVRDAKMKLETKGIPRQMRRAEERRKAKEARKKKST